MSNEISTLIGCHVEVLESSNSSLIGIKGKVTDETMNMLEIDNKTKLVKNQVTLKIDFNNHNYIIDGKLLNGRFEDRMKKGRITNE